MKRRKSEKSGCGRILDAWTPPQEAGEPVGCVATSFTFSPAFFEEECIGRFLQLETDASDDGPAYLVEREEKLSQLRCAAALVDQHHAHGVRNLRWDLLSARLPRGILHAKVTLLLWSQYARAIVASANLTEDGYRRNHEVFGVLDYFDGSETPLGALDELVEFLREAASYCDPGQGAHGPAVVRWNAFLGGLFEVSRSWGSSETPRSLGSPRVFAIVTGPGRPSVFDALRERWPDSTPPDKACVVSPFYDPPDAANEPARGLWSLLKQRGAAQVEFDLYAEDVPGEDAVLLHAPESVQEARPAGRNQTETIVNRLRLEDARPLHAKCLWLQNSRIILHMMGSSNFTSAGLGLGGTRNLEANLAFAVDDTRNVEAGRALWDAWLPTEEIPEGLERRWQPRSDEGEDSGTQEMALLPSAFGQAVFSHDEQGGLMEFTPNGEPPPGWKLFAEDETVPFAGEAHWRAEGSPSQFRRRWGDRRPPSGFRVSWDGSTESAWWPVNVADGASLPPPSELRDLPLEALISILSSARPLHHALRRWLGRSSRDDEVEGSPVLDPHKRVDTSTFLLQRTRRASWALAALRERLERPVISEQALAWRIDGPIGVRAFARAIGKEAHSEQERCFLLTELCLELARVNPHGARDSLEAGRVRGAIRDVCQDIRNEIESSAMAEFPALAAYAEAAFREAHV